MKRILRYVLLCTMLVGCDHQEMNLQAHHLDAKRQGFDQEEIESLIREPENANKVNQQLKTHISHPSDENREDFFASMWNESLTHKECKGVCPPWMFKFVRFMTVPI
ncbi:MULTISPECIES: hypothetical protein [Geobacillus thermoleovorans group]|uniref:hypothetical protein n=1 Tax=Geobacillus thermoleovorans group TaxID=1505648 RepID=UPI001CC2088B|nr:MULTISPECIES: hypothetical protein [Geobacillus thermoleovorans group]WMJ19586.1 hypothetical protein RA957_15530 [Geobacillus kaustophilus]